MVQRTKNLFSLLHLDISPLTPNIMIPSHPTYMRWVIPLQCAKIKQFLFYNPRVSTLRISSSGSNCAPSEFLIIFLLPLKYCIDSGTIPMHSQSATTWSSSEEELSTDTKYFILSVKSNSHGHYSTLDPYRSAPHQQKIQNKSFGPSLQVHQWQMVCGLDAICNKINHAMQKFVCIIQWDIP